MLRCEWLDSVLPQVTPDIALAPFVGWPAESYRFEYGGGYFDRTFAAQNAKHIVIGIGFEGARLATIYPQRLGMPLDLILTGTGRKAMGRYPSPIQKRCDPQACGYCPDGR